MADISGGGGGGGGGAYTYVQDTQPSAPEEGESWYDTAGNAAFVYDGAAWIEQTVADHSELSGVGSSDHHSRPSGTSGWSGRSSISTRLQQDIGTSRTDHSNFKWLYHDVKHPVLADGAEVQVDCTYASGGNTPADNVQMDVYIEGVGWRQVFGSYTMQEGDSIGFYTGNHTAGLVTKWRTGCDGNSEFHDFSWSYRPRVTDGRAHSHNI